MDWEQKAIQNLLPLSQNQKSLKAALSEWSYNGNLIDYGSQVATCDLCDHERLRYHFEIINFETKAALSVGSTCITRFNIRAIDQQGIVLVGKKRDKYLSTEIQRVKFEKSLEPLRLLWKQDEQNRKVIERVIQAYKETQKLTPKATYHLFSRMKYFAIEYDPSLYTPDIKSFNNRMEYISLSLSQQQIVQETMTQEEIDSFYNKRS